RSDLPQDQAEYRGVGRGADADPRPEHAARNRPLSGFPARTAPRGYQRQRRLLPAEAGAAAPRQSGHRSGPGRRRQYRPAADPVMSDIAETALDETMEATADDGGAGAT